MMKKITQISIALFAMVLIASCGGSKKEDAANINDKKAALEKLKSEKIKNDAEIAKLQSEVDKLSGNAGITAKTKLVSISPIVSQGFKHYIDLQGHVDAENISYISPRGMGGQVRAVYVQQGQNVKKGQLLLKLDDAIVQQQVVATRQQLDGIKTQLSFAKNIYQRQKNLWDQGIGTEVQLITAKTNVESLENQLKAAGEQVNVAIEQSKTSNVYSDVNGVADIVNIRVGETFAGMTAAGPQIKIVNTSTLKVVSNLPENYLGTVRKGSPVVVELPDAHKTINTTVSFTGASIDLINRGFVVEARLPSDPALKPNLIALMKIMDYNSDNAISVPLNTIQNDEKGKYVMVASSENGKLVARKRTVIIGMLNNDILEIKSGLKAGESLITEGYTGLYEGQPLKTQL
jgi:RND family efflux transporter MFP subunit